MIEALIAGISFFIGFLMSFIPLNSKIGELKKKINECESEINKFMLTSEY